ncbi:hypothetical protein Tco_1148155, partial [Tanacetum coccineum]
CGPIKSGVKNLFGDIVGTVMSPDGSTMASSQRASPSLGQSELELRLISSLRSEKLKSRSISAGAFSTLDVSLEVANILSLTLDWIVMDIALTRLSFPLPFYSTHQPLHLIYRSVTQIILQSLESLFSFCAPLILLIDDLIEIESCNN